MRLDRLEGGSHAFLVFDFSQQYPEAKAHIADLMQRGALQFKEDVSEGIDSMAGAFLKLLHSENFGKQLVRI